VEAEPADTVARQAAVPAARWLCFHSAGKKLLRPKSVGRNLRKTYYSSSLDTPSLPAGSLGKNDFRASLQESRKFRHNL